MELAVRQATGTHPFHPHSGFHFCRPNCMRLSRHRQGIKAFSLLKVLWIIHHWHFCSTRSKHWLRQHLCHHHPGSPDVLSRLTKLKCILMSISSTVYFMPSRLTTLFYRAQQCPAPPHQKDSVSSAHYYVTALIIVLKASIESGIVALKKNTVSATASK